MIRTKRRKEKRLNRQYVFPIDSLRYQKILAADLAGNLYQYK